MRADAAQETIQQMLAIADRIPPRLMVQPWCSLQRSESKIKKVKLCKKYARRYPAPIGRRLMDLQKMEAVRQIVTNPPITMDKNATAWETVYMVSSWMSSDVSR